MRKILSLAAKYRIFIISCVLSLLFGGIIFILLYGVEVINPMNDTWLIKDRHQDLSQGYIAWEFFRNSQWHFPLGIFNDLSYPLETSIINTDSIPLFAIFFKILSPILPDKFQYYGIYGLACYMLTSFFGMLLIYKYSKKTILGKLNAIFIGILFALIPSITFKLYVHTALASQWLILLSLLVLIYSENISLKNRCIVYSIIAVLSAGIHTYFIPMTFIILVTDTIYAYLKNKDKKIFYAIFCYLMGGFTALYLLGFFNMNIYMLDGSQMYLYTHYHKITFASFFKATPKILYNDNYMYIGYGIYTLFFIVLVSFIKRLLFKQKIINNKYKFIAFVVLAIVSAIIALISNIAIMLPETILKLLSIIRFVGRYMWITIYILVTLSLIYLVKYHKDKIVMSVILACILLQYNVCYALETSKYILEQRYAHVHVLSEYVWDTIAQKNNIKIVNFDEEIIRNISVSNESIISITSLVLDIAQWAYEHNIKTNDYYFSKDVSDIENIYNKNFMYPDSSMLFVFLRNDYNIKKIQASALTYMYIIDDIILARNIPIIGLEKYRRTF